jgi:DNA-binding transcriptional ArsR family regulator
MSAGIASLHKILKDETRRKIILQLHEEGSLSYVDLMKAIGIANTGKMN